MRELFKYEKSISRICTKFRKIDFLHLKALDDRSIHSIEFLKDEKKMQNAMLYRNLYTEIINTAFDWAGIQINEMGKINVQCSDKKNIVIGVTPELFFSGYRDTRLDEPCVNIIVLTENKISYKDLLQKMNALFQPSKTEQEYKAFYELMLLKIEYLIINKLVFIE